MPAVTAANTEEPWHDAGSLMRAALSGKPAAWPPDAPVSLPADIVDAAAHHGADVLLHESIKPEWNWPPDLCLALRERSLQLAMYELRHGEVVARLIAAFGAAGIRNILIKGTALAYTSYTSPVCRVRADTDLLVSKEDIGRAQSCLRALGYMCEDPNRGKRYIYQLTYTFCAPDRSEHCVDLHWQVSNSSFLSQRFPFAELYAQARPAPRLHPAALVHGTADALLITSLHRASHRYIGDRLIWLYDIHLLVGEMRQPDWPVLIARARLKGLCSPLLGSFELATRHLGTRVPRDVLSELAEGSQGEKVPAYLSSGPIKKRRMDWGALRDASDRVGYIAEMLWPPRSYMVSKYPNARIRSLPVLHARRLAEGAGAAVAMAWRSAPLLIIRQRA